MLEVPVCRWYGSAGGTGMQNPYQESLVWNWKNVKKVCRPLDGAMLGDAG